MKSVAKSFKFLLLALPFTMLACGNDGVYNEETNREAVKKKKMKRDSIRKVERAKKDTAVKL